MLYNGDGWKGLILKPVEFNAKVSSDCTLRIPKDLAEEIPPESTVHVALTPVNQHQSRLETLKGTFGSCKDDSLDKIFQEIDRNRHTDMGRDIDIP